jgi:hypothetical protein
MKKLANLAFLTIILSLFSSEISFAEEYTVNYDLDQSDYVIHEGKVYFCDPLSNSMLNNELGKIGCYEIAAVEDFEYLGDYFIAIKGELYYYRNKIDGGDPNSLEIINAHYAKDQNNVYFGNNFYHKRENLLDADPDTFEVLDGIYAKDKNYLYYQGKAYHFPGNLDAAKPLDNNLITDGEEIYYPYSPHAISDDHIGILNPQVDTNSFEILNEHFARDIDNIYYIHIIPHLTSHFPIPKPKKTFFNSNPSDINNKQN